MPEEQPAMIEMVPVRKLQEEDVFAIEKMNPAVAKKLGLRAVISAKMIASLRKGYSRHL